MLFCDLKTIDIIGKEWFDKINGNSYCSVKIILNDHFLDREEISLPMTYGYGDYYIQRSYKWLCNHFGLENPSSPFVFKDIGIHERHFMERRCKKRDVKSFGEGKES